MKLGFFNTTLQLKGFPIKMACCAYGDLRSLPGDELIKWVDQKKWEIFNYHLKENSQYQHILDGREITSWEQVPVLTKKFFQSAERPVSKPFEGESLYWSKTSGSSGVPLFFAKDKWAHALTWADIIYRFGELGLSYGQDLQARFYGMPLEGMTYYKEKLKDALSRRKRFIVHDMSEEVLDRYICSFKRKPFDYIYGYTNSILLFCRFLDKQGINLSQACPTLKACVVTSEVCTDHDKDYIHQVLGLPVYNEYGCSEFGVLALHNKHNEWEITGVNDFVEILDDDNRPVPDNQVGKIVVTSLNNKAMPFIRYEIGDRGSICHENGKVILKSLEGRLNDVLELPSGKVVPGFTLYYVLKAIMEKFEGLKEYKIWQTEKDHLLFQIVSDNPVSDELRIKIENVVEKYLEKGIKATIENVEKIDRTSAGKMKHFESLLNGK